MLLTKLICELGLEQRSSYVNNLNLRLLNGIILTFFGFLILLIVAALIIGEFGLDCWQMPEIDLESPRSRYNHHHTNHIKSQFQQSNSRFEHLLQPLRLHVLLLVHRNTRPDTSLLNNSYRARDMLSVLVFRALST